MDFSIYFKDLAHTYVIQGNKLATENELRAALEEHHDIVPHNNPDFWSKHFITFNVQDAKELRDAALRRKSGEGKRVFIINADAMTREASNSMLKMLEEPTKDTHFFIIVPSLARVLPTVISRARSVLHASKHTTKLISPEKFINVSIPMRMSMVKDILVQLEKEEVTKSEIIYFTEELIRIQYRKGKANATHAEIASYASDQSSSAKMVLEYLALSL